jgi:pyruvate formate lyase activating enzyme
MRNDFIGLAGWLKNSFLDFPGTVSTVLFFSGCNLRCPYCHNPDLLQTSGPLIHGSDDVWTFLEKRRGIIDGVVFTGGEPTLHDSLVTSMREIRALGYRLKLDTNGMLPHMIETCSPDYLALDVKTDPSLYRPVLKAPFADADKRLLRAIDIVKSMGPAAEIRITAAPGMIDISVIERLAALLEGVHRVFIQPMNRFARLLDPAFSRKAPLSESRLEQFRQMLASRVEHCAIRGGAKL